MHLDLIVLKTLNDGNKSGYGLIKNIKESTGWKPSTGSMYPLLDKLLRNKLVGVKEVGRKKIYHITKDGRDCLLGFNKKREKLVEEMKSSIKVIENICNIGDTRFLVELMDRLKKSDAPFGAITKDMIEFRDELFKLLNKDFEKNSAKIKKILKNTIKEFREIK